MSKHAHLVAKELLFEYTSLTPPSGTEQVRSSSSEADYDNQSLKFHS